MYSTKGNWEDRLRNIRMRLIAVRVLCLEVMLMEKMFGRLKGW